MKDWFKIPELPTSFVIPVTHGSWCYRLWFYLVLVVLVVLLVALVPILSWSPLRGEVNKMHNFPEACNASHMADIIKQASGGIKNITKLSQALELVRQYWGCVWSRVPVAETAVVMQQSGQ